ncbi:peptide deformylase [Risungbinella massiliensis]|uniref:peptide deformylase n=1 Tax=Risungbinella massiliensis TaxID=1329796 RepID=UPI0005CBFB46|nr:peptide deformylase [Risungbinella massiliensis]
MGIRQIVKYPDPILKQVAKPVTRFNERLHTLLDDMADTMYEAMGVGLAAPQIAISKRILVVDIGEGLHEIINPEIVEQSGEQIEPSEGCLSIPGLVGDVRRANKIRVQGQDRNGNPIEIEAEGYLSRAFQHEIDHLNGVLFIDIAEKVWRPSEEE